MKILETFRKPVLAYDVEEYIHGPYNSLDENSFMDERGEKHMRRRYEKKI